MSAAAVPQPRHLRAVDAPLPRVAFPEFMRRLEWHQGEHVTAIGPTGLGKTTLLRELLPLRGYVMFLATKKQDDTVSKIEGDGFTRLAVPEHPQVTPRVIVYPPFPRDARDMLKAHAETFRRALNEAYHAGAWTVVADEARYLTKDLRLEPDMQRLWLQGRSLGVSLVAATQRPRWIPLEAYDQATHLFLWRESDEANIRRLAEISGDVDRHQIMRTVRSLPRHDFLYVNTRTGQTAISNTRR